MGGSALRFDPVTGDLIRSAGRFSRVSDIDWQAQAIRSAMLFFLGEWFLDLTGVGLPWLQSPDNPSVVPILGAKAARLPYIRDLMRAELLKLTFIATVDTLELELDGSTRALTVTVAVTNTDGVSIPGFTVPLP